MIKLNQNRLITFNLIILLIISIILLISSNYTLSIISVPQNHDNFINNNFNNNNDVTILKSGDKKQFTLKPSNSTFFTFEIRNKFSFKLEVQDQETETETNVYLQYDRTPSKTDYLLKSKDQKDHDFFISSKTNPSIIQNSNLNFFVECEKENDRSCVFEISLILNTCPNNCSNPNIDNLNHGICDFNTRECHCNEHFTLDDCSAPIIKKISYNKPNILRIKNEGYFSFLINSSQIDLQSPSQLFIKIDSPSDNPFYVITLRNGKLPTDDNFDVRKISFDKNTIFKICLDFLKKGELFVRIKNEHLNYQNLKIRVHYITYCPSHCNGNGECDFNTGLCKCSDGFIGNDCSVNNNKIMETKIIFLLLFVIFLVISIILFLCLVTVSVLLFGFMVLYFRMFFKTSGNQNDSINHQKFKDYE